MKRSSNSERAKVFLTRKYIVDRLHIQGHIDEECLNSCNPKLFPELKDVNTVVCEQVNYWLRHFKHIVKHMNFYRFNFFLYIILDLYNQAKIDKKIKNTEKFFTGKSDNSKRFRD